jgi:hypothetical protein
LFEYCRPDQLIFPIWLLADSLPKALLEKIKEPLDTRHPTRHSIWTSVLNEIKATVYFPDRRRVNEDRLCICNAATNKHDGDPDWNFDRSGITDRIHAYGEEVSRYKPSIVLVFGRRAFEFARWAFGETPRDKPIWWNCEKLGNEFRKRIDNFDPAETNLCPLLHASIARGRFLEAHNLFTNEKGGNYFKFVGCALGELLKHYSGECDVWI